MSNISLSYPILGEYFDENQLSDYVNGAYKFEQIKKQDNENLHFRHILKGNNLISELFKKDEIKFCITAVVKSTMYRHTFLADNKFANLSQDFIEISQAIKQLKQNEIRHYFGCIIYVGDEKEIALNSDTMGLDSFWDKTKINLKKGQILARDSWIEDKKTIGNLISVCKDDSVKYGFLVEIDSVNGVFLVKMNEILFSNLQNEKNMQTPLYFSLVNNIFCTALYELEKFAKDSELHDNFKQLISQIKANGFEGLESENFSPSQIASSFVPFKFNESEINDD